MADEEQLHILMQGPDAWNTWRQQAGNIQHDFTGANFNFADLSGADLSNAFLGGASFRRAGLRHVNLGRANLSEASLRMADLSQADLTQANLCEADLRDTHLTGANFSLADLSYVDLHRADFGDANFDRARLAGTGFSGTDLSRCKSLETIIHMAPSLIDIETLKRSGHLPLVFLRGVGLPDTLIEYLPSLLNQAIQHYSCFISYSSKDEDFTRRLHADLQDKGVRCWFAPEDMKIGAKIRDTLDEAIRLRDKLLLVLSEASIASEWVEDEVEKAFEEERQRGSVVLFPVRVDDAVLETNEAWAAKLRRSRHIGDFRTWKDHDAYQRTLERLLRDLRVEKTKAD